MPKAKVSVNLKMANSPGKPRSSRFEADIEKRFSGEKKPGYRLLFQEPVARMAAGGKKARAEMAARKADLTKRPPDQIAAGVLEVLQAMGLPLKDSRLPLHARKQGLREIARAGLPSDPARGRRRRPRLL